MSEPQKRKLSEFIPDKKEPIKIRMESIDSDYQDLCDDFGYILTIEAHNENNNQDNS